MMNKLLLRQLKKFMNVENPEALKKATEFLKQMSNLPSVPSDVKNILSNLDLFISIIDRTYNQFDRDENLRTRSLELSSDELVLANQKLSAESEFQSKLLISLKESTRSLLSLMGKEESKVDDSDLQMLSDLISNIVSEYKTVLIELHNSENKYRSVVENLKEVIFQTDSNGSWIFLNPAWTEITGYTMEETLGKSFLEFVHPNDKGRYLNLFKLLIEKKEEFFRSEVRFLMKSEGFRWFEVYAKLIFDENNSPIGFLGTLNDTTEKREVKDELIKAKVSAESAARAKSEFLATISHEIRTPMNGVIGMTELLLETELNNKQKEFVETIKISGETLLNLINDILDFTKIDSGKMQIEEQSFDLRTCIEESLDVLAANALEKKIDLLYLLDNNVPQYILSDLMRLRQILVNLISNALKFTEKGEIFVSVSLLNQVNDEMDLLFAVKDTGIGIPDEKKDALFKTFSQVDASTTRKYGGTGLGLAICSRLVELMGGSIWVESQVNKGSIFYFNIKAKAPLKTERVTVSKLLPEIKNKNVLIVDDNKTNRRILSLQTEQWGMKCIAAESGKDALEILKSDEKFDIAIIDMLMPEMDGVQLGKEIRKLKSKEELPIIMLTSYGKQEKEIKDFHEIFSFYLTKPVKQSHLYDAILGIFLSKEKTKSRQESHTGQKLDKKLSERIPIKILIAEDNHINQKLLILILKQMGYEADIAENGNQVIDNLKKKPYDLIFMDIQMPELDGVEASRYIVKNWDESSRPKIIAMTADVMKGSKERCIAAGMVDFIGKPIFLEDVQRVIEKYGIQRLNSRKKMEIAG